MTASHRRLMIVGQLGPIDVGSHLLGAAETLGIAAEAIDYSPAYSGPRLTTVLSWRLRGRRPLKLESFSRDLIAKTRSNPPEALLTTGFAPVSTAALRELRKLGTKTLAYLTDDPWSPTRHSPWFFEALPLYDHVFSTRKANLEQLRSLGCASVAFVPFAYAPEVHFPDPPTPEDKSFHSDVAFVGRADRERLPYMEALIEAGLDVALYGGYWDRQGSTRSHARGHVTPAVARKAIGGTKVAPCLVRRSNRDGSSMRTFEVPAMGGCPVFEDTTEHREIFGPNDQSFLYFSTPAQLVKQTQWLLERPEERRRLVTVAHSLVTDSEHTYADRLRGMLVSAEIDDLPRRRESG
jgi:spore maturation protein CgeB